MNDIAKDNELTDEQLVKNVHPSAIARIDMARYVHIETRISVEESCPTCGHVRRRLKVSSEIGSGKDELRAWHDAALRIKQNLKNL
jgi:hypothetical protein